MRTRLRAKVPTAEAACSGGHCSPKASNLPAVWTFLLTLSSPVIFYFSPWTLAISNGHYCMLRGAEQNSNEVPELIRALQPPTRRCPFHQTPRRLQDRPAGLRNTLGGFLSDEGDSISSNNQTQRTRCSPLCRIKVGRWRMLKAAVPYKYRIRWIIRVDFLNSSSIRLKSAAVSRRLGASIRKIGFSTTT